MHKFNAMICNVHASIYCQYRVYLLQLQSNQMRQLTNYNEVITGKDEGYNLK